MSRKTIITAIAAIIAFSPSAAFAQWSNPTSAPTSANASAPLNVSASGQSKAGGLIVNTGGATIGLIVQSGTVGIGTSNPGFKLDVNGSTGINGNLNLGINTGNGIYAYNSVSSGGTHNFSLSRQDTLGVGDLEIASYGGIGFQTAQTGSAPAVGAKMYLTSSGNLGIGNNAPTYKLEVNGNIAVDAGGGFYYASDRRLKTDIAPLSSALDNILKLQGVSFTWKDSGKKSVGLIAQDVEKVYPELVGTNPTTGMKSVEYGNLVAPLIEAVKAQQKEIDALKQEVADLKAAR